MEFMSDRMEASNNYGFEFSLSEFQIQAIEGILAGHNVLVTAPTGSGKTLPAEFCIRENVLQRRKKVIYCSPIKALSNQKFYEFSRKYSDMGIQFGLITGDIKTNPNADVIIMTTEILYNHLVRGSVDPPPLVRGSVDPQPLVRGSVDPPPLVRGSVDPQPLVRGSVDPPPLVRGSVDPPPLVRGSVDPPPLVRGSGPDPSICVGEGSGGKGSNGGLQFQMNLEEELAAVIFDEIHYINDPDRGKVWEGCIMMLPPTVQVVGLSATLERPDAFAEWIQYARPDKKTILCQTSHRQVPLSHYVYLAHSESLYKKKKEPTVLGSGRGRGQDPGRGPGSGRGSGSGRGQGLGPVPGRGQGQGSGRGQGPAIDATLAKEMRDSTNKLLLLQDATGKFQDTTYRTATKVIDTYRKQQVSVPRKHVLNSLMTHLRDQEMIPAIAFVFSRKQVETCAHDITVNLLEGDSKVPYIARRECEQIVRKLPNYEEYMRLPEYESLVKLLEKGIGIHHAGMLPVLREIVELFISKRYIKLLCCTETFAIGLDCPIRTAIFTNIYKYTGTGGNGGNAPRLLHAHEYAQASGRAGRRGLDEIGYVVHCANLFDLPTVTEYRAMTKGTPQTLSSKFKINYSWLLHLILSGRGRPADWHDVIRRSMFYDELQSALRGQEMSIARAEEALREQSNVCDALSTPMDVCVAYLAGMTPDHIPYELPSVRGLKAPNLGVVHTEYVEGSFRTSPYGSSFNTVFASKKRRAEMEKERAELLATWGDTLTADVAEVNRLHSLQREVEREHGYMNSMKTCISHQTDGILDILLQKRFIAHVPIEDNDSNGDNIDPMKLPQAMDRVDVLPKEDPMKLTNRGRMAAAVAEIHPLALVDVLDHTGFFWEYDVVEIIGWLAMYTDIKPQSGNREFGGVMDMDMDDKKGMGEDLYGIYTFVAERYQEYQELEQRADLNTGTAYHGVVQTVLMLPMMEWANLTTEIKCKTFVQVRLADLGISLGDFSRSVLKISAMVKELVAMCEICGESALEFQSKLSHVDAHILKYVIMNQSLYV